MVKNGLLIATLLLGCASQAAQAQIYELAFTDTNNATVVKSPSVTWYNPKGTITVTHIAGLDRKVKLELLQGTTVVSTQTSALLTVANRITASDGQAFYGVKFTLPAPAEGNYVLRSTVYDITGAQVSSNSYIFNIDVTKPVFSGTWHWGQWARSNDAMPDDWLMGPFEARRLWINGVTDKNSGVSSTAFYSKALDGEVYYKTAAVYTNNEVGIGTNSYWSVRNGVHFPAIDAQLMAAFEIADQAGNILYVDKRVKWNGRDDTPYTLVGVHNPNYSGNFLPGSPFIGFEAVTSATQIHENPWSAVYRIKKTDWYQNNEFGFSLGYNYCGDNPDYSDDTYVYKKVSGVYQTGQFPYPVVGTCSITSWRAGGVAHNLSLADDAPKSPAVLKVETLWSDHDWTTNNMGARNTEVSLLGTRVQAEVRTYVQVFSQAGLSCSIPVGQTTCQANGAVNFAVNSTPTIYWPSWSIRSQDGTLSQNADINFTIDGVPPTLNGVSVDKSAKLVTMTGVEPDTGASWGSVTINTGWIEAANGAGTKTTLPASQVTKSGGNDFSIAVSLLSLPDGIYSLVALARDNYGNVSAPLSAGSITIDNTPPAIAFNYNGAAVPAGINKITDLRVILTDTVDSAPLVTTMTLAGGPINDALQLGFSKQPNGWAPEVPRMFPTLEAGQEYTITVTAKDAQGNSTTKSQKFGLTPANLVSLADIKTFAVAQSLKDKSDVPLSLVKFKGALTDGQTQSRGNQSGYITLRSDSAFAVIFNGLLVQPGETKDVVIPLDATGQASLPIYPATSGVAGKSSYMIDIPQLTVN